MDKEYKFSVFTMSSGTNKVKCTLDDWRKRWRSSTQAGHGKIATVPVTVAFTATCIYIIMYCGTTKVTSISLYNLKRPKR